VNDYYGAAVLTRNAPGGAAKPQMAFLKPASDSVASRLEFSRVEELAAAAPVTSAMALGAVPTMVNTVTYGSDWFVTSHMF